jgi:hypothetical protein
LLPIRVKTGCHWEVTLRYIISPRNLSTVADTQTVLIDFQIDDSQLVSALERLEKSGSVDLQMATAFKQTSSEINKQANEIKKTAAATVPLKKNLEDVNRATKQFTQDFMTGFNDGVLETLKEAGVSAEEFSNALASGQTEVEKSSDSLRQRLKVLTEQIAQMKLAGEDGTEQFQKLVIEAGNIKDAMADAGAEIRNAGSDTETFDNLLGAAQAVAGGFAVAQGAAALFGDENEELQKTLLKVNAVMAVLQGLQSVSASLEKEGALSLLATNIQLKVKNAQKVIETGLESESIIVRGAATVAQKALNLAMAANPIGILVVAVAGLIAILATYGRSAAAARQQTSNLNVALGAGVKAFEDESEAIKRTGANAVNELENQGVAESKISARRLQTEQQLAEKRKQFLKDLLEKQARNTEADLEKRKELSAKIRQLQDEEEADGSRVRDLEVKQQKIVNEERLKNTIAGLEAELSAAEEGSKNQLSLQRRLIAARTALELNADGLLAKEKEAIAAKGREADLEAVAAANKRKIDLDLESIDTQLINVKEGSEEELKLKKKQVDLQTQSELTNTKLSEDEKTQIKKDGFEKQLKLQRDYNKRVTREAIEDQISRNEAEITQLITNDQDRLILQIANIELAAAAEVNAAEGNSAKIKEINAKRDADILAVRKQFIDDAAQYEIDIRTADNGPSNRALQKTINDEKKSLEFRKAAIRQLAAEQIKDIDTRLKALQDEKDQRLISDKDYNLKYKQLQDQKKQINEKTEEEITAKTKEQNKLRADVAFAALNAIATVISDINANQTQQEQNRIEGERQRVAELLEAGAITEDEAKKRNKRIDQEEKKLKREQAQREKNLAIFNAFINTAQAITMALASAPPPFNAILAAIAGALGAAQIAAISSRPIPKFAKGKKDRYEGPGEIGEAGMELMQHDGQLYLAKKRTLVWLGKDDKVYNPTETKEMLMPTVDKHLMQWTPPEKKAEGIDYDKLAKAVGKHIKLPGFNIDEQGFKIWQQEGLSRTNYMDKRYSSK